jgi:hypothetical protein
MLPEGEYVTVSPDNVVRGPEYAAKVVGYNADHTKYHLGAEVKPGEFARGGSWAYPHEVTPRRRRH